MEVDFGGRRRFEKQTEKTLAMTAILSSVLVAIILGNTPCEREPRGPDFTTTRSISAACSLSSERPVLRKDTLLGNESNTPILRALVKAFRTNSLKECFPYPSVSSHLASEPPTRFKEGGGKSRRDHSWEERLTDDTGTGQQWLVDHAEAVAATYGASRGYWNPFPQYGLFIHSRHNLGDIGRLLPFLTRDQVKKGPLWLPHCITLKLQHPERNHAPYNTIKEKKKKYISS